MQQQLRKINCSSERAIGGMGTRSRKQLTIVQPKHDDLDCNIEPDDEHLMLEP
jgi:hypothetical protein